MKIKCDENLPREAAELFRSRGHEADDVHEENLDGSDDEIIFQVCQREQRILITLDLDFANPYEFSPGACGGIIVLRPSTPGKKRTMALLSRVLSALEADPIAGRLWMVDESRIRIRGDL